MKATRIGATPKRRGTTASKDSASAEAQPFLKWAGGKGQLLSQLDPFFPKGMARYIEPFVGGGAVFFHLKAGFPQMQPFLRDNNAEIVNAFTMVRDAPDRLMELLDGHRGQYEKDGDHYYYLIRSQHRLVGPVERAARVIFLNKTCFNGLWRVNSRGEFNVPVGSSKKASLYDRTNLLAASRALHGADLKARDFRETLMEAGNGDFAYVDPPYHPLSPTSAFTAYTKDDFGVAEQEELAAIFADASRKGAKLMLSNSDTKFVRKLYQNFEIREVQARRAINCRGDKRGIVSEVVVTNY